MTAVERTPHEPGPSSGYTDFSDTEQEVDWSELEREPKNTRNTQGVESGGDQETDEVLNDADEDKLFEDQVDTPRSNSSDESVEKRKKFDTPYPRIKSPNNSPRHSSSSIDDNHPNSVVDESPGDERKISSSTGSQDEEDYDDETFEMTEDQRLAMRELQEMKIDLGYAADEDPPEYDVAERVRQLNEDLANDPTPVEDDRERSIKFKSNLVDLVAPPPDLSESEDGSGDNAEYVGKSDNTNNEESSSNQEKCDDTKHNFNGSGDDGNDDKILVHRNDKFELISAKDLTAEERMMYIPENDDSLDTPRSTESAPEVSNHQPRPPTQARPKTATNGSNRRSNQSTGDKRRAKSAEPHLNANRDCEDFNYTSPYAMTSEERKRTAREQKEKDKQKKQEEDEKKKMEEKRKEEGSSAFDSWLKKKRDEAVKRKQKDEKNEKDESENEEGKEKKDAFDEWQQEKQKQQKQQKEVERKRRDEEKQELAWATRSQKECDKAYKQWLKNKRKETKKQREEETRAAKLYRLMARRTRKSQALVLALKQDRVFRYEGYYGYRN